MRREPRVTVTRVQLVATKVLQESAYREVLPCQRAKKRAPEFVDSVLAYQGRPVYQTMTASWCKALKRARIRDFRWHDLRHTWASWYGQRGTPLQVLKELGG